MQSGISHQADPELVLNFITQKKKHYETVEQKKKSDDEHKVHEDELRMCCTASAKECVV